MEWLLGPTHQAWHVGSWHSFSMTSSLWTSPRQLLDPTRTKPGTLHEPLQRLDTFGPFQCLIVLHLVTITHGIAIEGPDLNHGYVQYCYTIPKQKTQKCRSKSIPYGRLTHISASNFLGSCGSGIPIPVSGHLALSWEQGHTCFVPRFALSYTVQTQQIQTLSTGKSSLMFPYRLEPHYSDRQLSWRSASH